MERKYYAYLKLKRMRYFRQKRDTPYHDKYDCSKLTPYGNISASQEKIILGDTRGFDTKIRKQYAFENFHVIFDLGSHVNRIF